MAFARGAPGVDVEQLGGGIADLLGRAALGFLPLARAEFVQRRFIGTHAGVAADHLQLAHGHIQRGLVGVFQVQELLLFGLAIGAQLPHIHVDEAAVAPNAVRAVYHRVAHIELAQVFDQRLDIADLLLFFATAGGGPGGEQLGLGDEVDAHIQPRKTGAQRRGGHAQRLGAGGELLQRIKHRWAHATGAQQV